MSDQRLLDVVAELWLDSGADSEGFLWNVQALHQVIVNKQFERKEKEIKDEQPE